MPWQSYRVVWRLRSPLRVGWRSVGNLQQTRPYVPGKVVWGALTARLTRDLGNGADGKAYRTVGKRLQATMRFGYFWPTTAPPAPRYPWNEPAQFTYDFLASMMSTALDYESISAEEGSLHEAEYLRPYTPEGQRVYLTGFLWVDEEALAQSGFPWQTALKHVLLGGERRYGWGRVHLESLEALPHPDIDDPDAFSWKKDRLPAHVLATEEAAAMLQGPVEPLMGWEMLPDGRKSFPLEAQLAFQPGTKVKTKSANFRIGSYGVWEPRTS